MSITTATSWAQLTLRIFPKEIPGLITYQWSGRHTRPTLNRWTTACDAFWRPGPVLSPTKVWRLENSLRREWDWLSPERRAAAHRQNFQEASRAHLYRPKVRPLRNRLNILLLKVHATVINCSFIKFIFYNKIILQKV